MRQGLRTAVLAATCALALAAPAVAQALEPLSEFGEAGSGAGQLQEPGGIDIGPEGRVYVADYGNNRVDVFAPGGAFLFALGREVDPEGGDVCTDECQAGAGTSEPGALSTPEAVAVHDGHLYVSEPGNHRVSVFGLGGGFEFMFGKDVNDNGTDRCVKGEICLGGAAGGEAAALDYPLGIAFRGEELYVADGENNRVARYTDEGVLVSAFGKEVNPAGGDICTAECQVGQISGVGAHCPSPPTSRSAPIASWP